MNSTIRFIGKLCFIVMLFLLLFSFAMFQGGFVSWFLFYSYLPIFLYHIGLLLYPVKEWQVTRIPSRRIVHSGDTITVNVKMKRIIPFPLYYCVCEEIFPSSLKKIDSRTAKYHHLEQPTKLQFNRTMKKVIFPGFRRAVEFTYQLEQIPRGEHQLQAIRMRTGDIFGFVKKEHIFQVADQLVVYPNKQSIAITERVSSFEQGSVASNTLNAKHTNVATGIREYQPGDKFSWVDWKQSAKKNTMMTKEFEQEKSMDTVIMLDSCYYDEINGLAFEAAIEISLSLMEAIKKQASKVAFISIGKDIMHFPFHHNPREKDWMMQFLTRIQPDGTQPFAVRLKEASLEMASGSTVVIMTTHLDEPLKQTLGRIGQRSKRVIVIFVQAMHTISNQEQQIIKQLQWNGIVVNTLTEQQLVQQTIEVNV